MALPAIARSVLLASLAEYTEEDPAEKTLRERLERLEAENVRKAKEEEPEEKTEEEKEENEIASRFYAEFDVAKAWVNFVKGDKDELEAGPGVLLVPRVGYKLKLDGSNGLKLKLKEKKWDKEKKEYVDDYGTINVSGSTTLMAYRKTPFIKEYKGTLAPEATSAGVYYFPGGAEVSAVLTYENSDFKKEVTTRNATSTAGFQAGWLVDLDPRLKTNYVKGSGQNFGLNKTSEAVGVKGNHIIEDSVNVSYRLFYVTRDDIDPNLNLPGGGVWPEDDSLDMLVNVEGRLAAGQYVFLQGHVNNVMPEAGGADSFTQWGVAAGGTHLIAGEDRQVNGEPVKNARQWLSAAWDVDYYDIDAATWFALRASLDITAVQKAMVVFGPYGSLFWMDKKGIDQPDLEGVKHHIDQGAEGYEGGVAVKLADDMIRLTGGIYSGANGDSSTSDLETESAYVGNIQLDLWKARCAFFPKLCEE